MCILVDTRGVDWMWWWLWLGDCLSCFDGANEKYLTSSPNPINNMSLNCAYSDERLDHDSRIVEEYLIAGADMVH